MYCEICGEKINNVYKPCECGWNVDTNLPWEPSEKNGGNIPLVMRNPEGLSDDIKLDMRILEMLKEKCDNSTMDSLKAYVNFKNRLTERYSVNSPEHIERTKLLLGKMLNESETYLEDNDFIPERDDADWNEGFKEGMAIAYKKEISKLLPVQYNAKHKMT